VDTKPVPFTVSVKLDPPGVALVGTRGWLMRGTGFCASTIVLARIANRPTRYADFVATSDNHG